MFAKQGGYSFMGLFIQTCVTGLAIGGIYSLMAVGYSLIFSILNFSNFAFGMVIMLSSFIGYFSMTLVGVPFGVALFIAMLGAGLISFLNERIAYSSLRKRNAPPLYFMISAMGTAIFLENIVYANWRTIQRFSSDFQGSHGEGLWRCSGENGRFRHYIFRFCHLLSELFYKAYANRNINPCRILQFDNSPD